MNHLEHCDALELEIHRFTDLLRDADPLCSVPSCPGWSIRDLGEHLGVIHRWTEHLVRNQAPVRISSDDMNLERGLVSASWFLEGGSQLLATLRHLDPDLSMWAWGADQHVRFWSRRQLHETLMHRIDVEMALGLTPYVETNVAADAIDEFLANVHHAAAFSPRITELIGNRNRLAFTQSDGDNRWVVVLSDDGISVTRDNKSADVEFRANTLDLLLVLYRRRSIQEVDFRVSGDEQLLLTWLERTALE